MGSHSCMGVGRREKGCLPIHTGSAWYIKKCAGIQFDPECLATLVVYMYMISGNNILCYDPIFTQTPFLYFTKQS